jgi:hypothetical protein
MGSASLTHPTLLNNNVIASAAKQSVSRTTVTKKIDCYARNEGEKSRAKLYSSAFNYS